MLGYIDIYNEGPFNTLCNENPFNEDIFFMENSFLDQNQSLNDLSTDLNKEVRECSIPLGSESIDNVSRQECTSVVANHEEDAEDRMLTLDSSEQSYDADSIEALVEKVIQQSSLDSLVEGCCTNHEEDAEDRMLTLDSSEQSYDADSIEALVEKVIQQSSLDSLVEECCKSKEVKDPVKNSEKMRFKTTKTPLQLQRLEESLIKYPIKFPKKERKKLAEEIGLEETQVYKWYYDHKPKKVTKKSRKTE
eukprot:CAMPEP_0197016666 /NCGR_PEP_ID=MMETSP1380-20130617/79093_1 /TAXON_ID=5936 /ORGANISM="Euplotes crassus, Strain CT5" /LENGTH=248 /DNA_ID=CAMNT_0042443643 /DNA_START=26 /DNA_END=772 /DNA_ORIENTATION=+